MKGINRIGGINGTQLIKTTAVTDLQAETLVVRESSVLSVLSGTDKDGAAVNYLTVGNKKGIVGFVATEALKTGDIITCPDGYKITSVTLASGSILAY